MTVALTLTGGILPATPPEALDMVNRIAEVSATVPQLSCRTEHLIHAGMYARTVRLKPGTIITGVLLKRATILITDGRALVLVGDEWAGIEGYNVIPGSAGRKQVFVAITELALTMMFPTQAKTVDEAEREFTDEYDLLYSRGDGENLITITGE